MNTFAHTPVLPAATLAALLPQSGHHYIDATVGGGGHTVALLAQAGPDARVLGIDADPVALAAARQRAHETGYTPEQLTLAHGTFDNLTLIAQAHGFRTVAGVLFDLGVSSHQLDTPERGFSFRNDGPLDMRLDPTQGESAADLLARLDETTLADIIYRYGDERASRRIARRIVARQQQQPIARTSELAALVAQAMPGGNRRGKGAIHPATRTFQALRIAVNRELEQLEAALPQAVDLLQPGGRLAVISFHSLEDRIVKWFLRAESGYGGNEAPDQPVRLRIITRKPLEADEAEQQANPRSRSARLRVAERIHTVD